MASLEPLVSAHPFCRALAPEQVARLAACARERQFAADEVLVREGEEIREFFLIRSGRVALEIFTARRGPLLIQTREAGDFLGWLGLEPHALWVVDARALELTRVIVLPLECLNRLLDEDPLLGYQLLKRFTQGMAQHFASMKRQVVNLLHGL
jgi:CRP-like cAMP-binding protein